MILKLFRKSPDANAVYAIYRAIVAQSRRPRFYAELGVPDTVTGRFDMISLHVALLFRRLRAEGAEGQAFSQAVFDLFFKDMDRSLREMGVGDLAVPKRIQKMGNLFFGLMTKLNEALDRADRPEIEAILSRNIYGGEPSPHLAALADYVVAEAARVNALPKADIMAGTLDLAAAS